MRISDWSSDVCSSDLSTLLCHVWLAYSTAKGMRPTHGKNSFRYCWLRPGRHLARHQWRPCGGGELHAGADRPPALLSRRDQATDRKSVVSGKGVSVRVDLGGRRIIKKKNIQHRTHK